METKKIKLVICDVDGVLTDGRVYFSDEGKSMKSFCLKDFDAFTILRKSGVFIAFVTGEKDEITKLLKRKLTPEYFVDGCKDKYNVINKFLAETDIDWDEICFVGDGMYDIEPLKYAGVAVCPADAIDEVKGIENIHILKRPGGTGCISELLSMFYKNRWL